MYNNLLYHVIDITSQWGEHYFTMDAGKISFLFLKANKQEKIHYVIQQRYLIIQLKLKEENMIISLTSE